MLEPEDFNSENYRICWAAILAVFAVQMIVLITIHSGRQSFQFYDRFMDRR